MAKIRVTKQFEFEGAHALKGYDGKCRHIHGHSYKLFITVAGMPSLCKDDPKYGMVIDFSELKEIVNREIITPFDHSLMLQQDSPLAQELQTHYSNVIVLKFQPTCENLVLYIASILKRELAQRVELVSVKLYETATSFAEWYASDNNE